MFNSYGVTKTSKKFARRNFIQKTVKTSDLFIVANNEKLILL